MSSNIRVKKVCEFCKQDFEARKTTSKTCSDNCAKRLYKARLKNSKIQAVKIDTEAVKAKPIEDLKAKEFLSILETCKVLGISRRTIYRMFKRGEIKTGKAGTRSIIKRSELDKLFI
jgi:excisionase family DNA binding protein